MCIIITPRKGGDCCRFCCPCGWPDGRTLCKKPLRPIHPFHPTYSKEGTNGTYSNGQSSGRISSHPTNSTVKYQGTGQDEAKDGQEEKKKNKEAKEVNGSNGCPSYFAVIRETVIYPASFVVHYELKCSVVLLLVFK